MKNLESPCLSERLVEAAWGDLDERARAELDLHLEHCANCREELEALRWTLETVANEMPDPEEAREEDWRQLERRLDRVDRRRAAITWTQRIAASLVLLTVGYVLGSWQQIEKSLKEVEPIPIARTEPRPSSEVTAVAHFLDRSEPLLLLLSNQEAAGPDVALQRSRARELAAEAARLRADLIDSGEDRSVALVAELELIFLQWANLEGSESSPGTTLLRSTVDQRALLFKLSLERLRGEPLVPEV